MPLTCPAFFGGFFSAGLGWLACALAFVAAAADLVVDPLAGPLASLLAPLPDAWGTPAAKRVHRNPKVTIGSGWSV